MAALKWLYRYLHGNSDVALVFDGCDKYTQDSICYVDANWASDPNDQCSIFGFTVVLAGGTILWSSKKQHSTILSSTGTEYMAASNATKEALWLHAFLTELRFKTEEPLLLFIDNQSAITLVKNSTFYDRTKYIAIRYHFICKKYKDGEINVSYILTAD